MTEPITIAKKPLLPASENYDLLRATALEHIQRLGSDTWTDYNIHDPGITLLEALCYALTDLGYRTSLDIKDLLTDPSHIKTDYDRQAFFTARNILTINPWTVADFRKFLIDIDGVKNAWLFCKKLCPCEFPLYVDCKKSSLTYEPTEHKVVIQGFYDVLVEFEEDDVTGDLNSGKIKQNFQFPVDEFNDTYVVATMEARLPSWQQLSGMPAAEKFRTTVRELGNIQVLFISGNETSNSNIIVDELAQALRKPLFATIKITFLPAPSDAPGDDLTLQLDDVPLNIWFRGVDDRKALQNAYVRNNVNYLKDVLEDKTTSGIIARYFQKLHKADEVMTVTVKELHKHRNLAEDFCSIEAIEVQDIGVCADMEVSPEADIEQVLAQAYYLIAQYFAPDIRFYSLKELMDAGRPVDEIFDGPALNNGFIDNEQLESTGLKHQLHTSDVINLLMDIPGVKAIRNLVLVKYDKTGKNIGSETWTLDVLPNHQPRFYAEASKFLVSKSGLTFLADREELADTLQVIKGLHIQPKLPVYENDLHVPVGTYYQLSDYYPVQYSLPLTYGVGYEGLRAPASATRQAQAKQLKAYLLVFEQLLVNYLEQLSNLKELFAVDATVKKTYFSRLLDDKTIRNISEIINGLTSPLLQKLVEPETGFYDRRNRFLDHILSRFGEQFTDYALMLYSYIDNQQLTQDKLIQDKVAFLKALPAMMYNKAKAFNYKDPSLVCNQLNVAGLQKRIERLLGFKSLTDYFIILPGNTWKLEDDDGTLYLLSVDNSPISTIIASLAVKERYLIEKVKEKEWLLHLTDASGNKIGIGPRKYTRKKDAEAAMKAVIDFANKVLVGEKIFIVEHILLRPRHKPSTIPGIGTYIETDSLLSICTSPDCDDCDERDPYSFRITIVMSGEYGLANSGILFRKFAEQTIRQEVPAHLGVKICWVSNKQLAEFEKAYCAFLAELSKLKPGAKKLYDLLVALLNIFKVLKNIYPPASLHDCSDGDDQNRVFLNQTIIGEK